KAEETLFLHKIKAINKKEKGKLKLFVEKNQAKEAEEILANETEWTLLKSYSNIAKAMFHKSILDETGIPSVIINDKDRTFLLGEIELYTEKDRLEAARKIIANL
ncbi:MAG: DUF2007 domain-containing protein, partial [Bacteroidales bacterium]|nr:DUF2007 domain-containing protein [Bacteroidales bacterium]